MSASDVQLGLDKLVTQGGLNQIRDFLVERGITGVRRSASQCAISRYLHAEGFAQPDEHVDVLSDPKGEGAVHVVRTDGTTLDFRVLPLPRVLNNFAVMFDVGKFQELAEQSG